MGGVLFAAWGYVHGDEASPLYSATADVLAFVVPALFLVGLVGLHVRHRKYSGWIGRAGFALGFAGAAWGMAHALVIGPSFWPLWFALWSTLAPGKSWLPSLFGWFPLMLDGLVLAGIAAVHASGAKKVPARRGWGRLLLLVGSLGWAYHFTDGGSGAFAEARLSHAVFGVLFSLGWVALGYALWSSGKKK